MGHSMHRQAGRSGKREFQAGIGLRYKVAYTDRVRGFFSMADSILAREGNAPPQPDLENWRDERVREQFTLYNNPEKMGLTVVERRLTGARSERKSRNWNMHDMGRIKVDIKDALSELRLEYGFRPMGGLAMRMTGVIPVGAPSGRGMARTERKFALVPAPGDKTANFLLEAHERVGDILGLPPVGEAGAYDYTPKLTLGRIHNTVPTPQVLACGDALGALIAAEPVVISLVDQQIFGHQYEARRV